MRLQSKYNDISNIEYANNKLTEKKKKERKRILMKDGYKEWFPTAKLMWDPQLP